MPGPERDITSKTHREGITSWKDNASGRGKRKKRTRCTGRKTKKGDPGKQGPPARKGKHKYIRLTGKEKETPEEGVGTRKAGTDSNREE